MDRYCPECNSTMTPSLVGYLCPNCGNMQRFYSQSTTISPRVEIMGTDTEEATTRTDKTPITTAPTKATEPSQNKVRSTLKRLMVPELSPPHHEQIIVGDEIATMPAQKADKLPADFDASPSNDSKVYQPDQIAQDFDPPKQSEPTKHSNKWLWISLILFLLASAGLAALYFFYR
jgi:DNA-directed RNA polymerase subunit M/transcription elongation factor TFIIS